LIALEEVKAFIPHTQRRTILRFRKLATSLLERVEAHTERVPAIRVAGETCVESFPLEESVGLVGDWYPSGSSIGEV
jgi:hypothetical protein